MIRRTILAFGLAFGFLTTAVAGTASGAFVVQIRLDGSGLCLSQALSEETNALVSVTCSGGQFVSIAPAPDKPFAGTQGGAFRFHFEPLAKLRLLSGPPVPFGAGTVTALRVYNSDGGDGAVEMMVSF
ncbi:MAG: hypothetical protein JWQ13_1152 [Ramlibacter sp.]|nr:hypothetical protein [Ramlibacter sp.]